MLDIEFKRSINKPPGPWILESWKKPYQAGNTSILVSRIQFGKDFNSTSKSPVFSRE